MENDDLMVFKRFNDHEAAFELATWLHGHGIFTEIVDSTVNFDVAFSNNALNKEYSVAIRRMDFERADKLLLKEDQRLLNEVGKDYYLFEFSNEELMDIVEKEDEWSRFDFLLAQQILEERGNAVAPKKVEELKQQRVEELSKEESYPHNIIILGYILAIGGGLLGILIGWDLWTKKWIAPNGRKAYIYKEADRKHGRNIFYAGIAVFIILTIELVRRRWIGVII